MEDQWYSWEQPPLVMMEFEKMVEFIGFHGLHLQNLILSFGYIPSIVTISSFNSRFSSFLESKTNFDKNERKGLKDRDS